jgi:hypothetical protein
MPQTSLRSPDETSIHGLDGLRLCDRERLELERDRDELDRDPEERDRRLDELDRERLLVRRLLLERLVGVRLMVLRFAIAQMFSLLVLLYHSPPKRGNLGSNVADRIQTCT